MIRLDLIAIVITLGACTTTSMNNLRIIRSEKSEVKKGLVRGRALFDMGEIEAAITTLKAITDKAEYSKELDEAYELLVSWLMLLDRKQEATRITSFFLKNYPHSESAKKIIEIID